MLIDHAKSSWPLQLSCCLLELWLTYASSIESSILLLSVATFGIMAYGTTILTIPADIFPQKHIGFLMGFIGSSGSLAGAGFQLVVGRLVDQGSFLPIFTLAGILQPVAALILILGIRVIKPLECSENMN